MDLNTVFTKTSKGAMEVAGKSRDLSREQSRILTLVDGKSTIGEILDKAGRMSQGKLEQLLGALASEGFIRILRGGGQTHLAEELGFSSTIIVDEANTQAFFEAQVAHERRTRKREENEKAYKEQERDELLAELKAETEAAAREKADQERKQAEAAAKANAEAEQKARLAAEQQAAEHARRGAESKAKEDAELKAAAEAKVRAEAEARMREAEAARRKVEEEKQLLERQLEEAKLEAELESRAKRRLEARAREEEETRQRMEAEARAKLEEEARRRAEAEEKARAEAEARKRAEEAAKTQAEAERKAREEAEARAKAEAQARAEAEQRARQEAEAKARAQQEAERRAREEEAARQRAEAEARDRAEAERQAKQEAEAKARMDEEARRVEAEIKEATERAVREEAEAKAREMAEKEAAERKTRELAEERIRAEAAAAEREEERRRAKAAAENHARLEAEEARRRAEEQERFLMEEETREREEAEARAQALAQAMSDEQAAFERGLGLGRSRAKADIRKWLRYGGIGAAALLLLAFLLAHVISFNFYAPRLERQLAQALGERVKIGALSFSAFPAPRWKMEGVALGGVDDIKIAKAEFQPALGDWVSDVKLIKRVSLDGVAIDRDSLAKLPNWFERQAKASLKFERIEIKQIKLGGIGIEVPNFDARVDMSSGVLRQIVLTTSDQRVSVEMEPTAGGLKVRLRARKWAPPIGVNVQFDELDIEGVARDQALELSSIYGTLHGGTLKGSGRVGWGDAWKAAADIELKRINLATAMGLFTNQIHAEGTLDAKANVGAESPDIAGLLATPQVRATFLIREGLLGNIDLVRAINAPAKSTVSGGQTRFNDFSGYLQIAKGVYQYRQLRLSMGMLSASGTVEIQPDKTLSGTVASELKSRATAIKVPLTVSGTLATPVLRGGDAGPVKPKPVEASPAES